MISNLLGPVLDMVIGLSFIYFILSFIASAIQELVAALTELRARELEAALIQILGPQLKSAICNNAIIEAMGKKPAYIPARSFSLALFDHFARAYGEPLTLDGVIAALKKAVADPAKVGNPADKTREIAQAALALIEGGKGGLVVAQGLPDIQRWLQALEDSPDKQKTLAQLGQIANLDDLRIFAQAQLPPGLVRSKLLDWIDGGANALQAARSSIEVWFDDSMSRVSDTYKRYVKFLLIPISALIVLVSGADTIRLFNGFMRDPSTLAAVNEQARQLLATQITTTVSTRTGQPTVQIQPQAVYTLTNSLDNLQSVLGYGDLYSPDPTTGQLVLHPTAGQLVQKILGLLLTMAAVSLGAPFWFEILKRAANIRSTGAPPPTTVPTGAPRNDSSSNG